MYAQAIPHIPKPRKGHKCVIASLSLYSRHIFKLTSEYFLNFSLNRFSFDLLQKRTRAGFICFDETLGLMSSKILWSCEKFVTPWTDEWLITIGGRVESWLPIDYKLPVVFGLVVNFGDWKKMHLNFLLKSLTGNLKQMTGSDCLTVSVNRFCFF